MQPKVHSTCEYTLEDVRVGKAKDSLDVIGDFSILVADVTATFGRYLKYYVKSSEVVPALSAGSNAFEVMMRAQKTLTASSAQLRHPPKVPERNKRDQLFNDLISMVESKGLEWKSDEVYCGSATKAVQALRDTLWYIDGSHHTLAERSCAVPEIFLKFSGYNRPEMSKHRKRAVDSLARDTLLSHSQSLFGVLHYAFWSRPEWMVFKASVEQLARSLASYSDSLVAKRARIQAVHTSECSVRNIGDSLSVRFTRIHHSPPPYLAPIAKAVAAAGLNVPVELGALLPTERRRRYDWVTDLKRGLQVPLVHLTYSPGSNLGNLFWVWHCTASDIDEVLQTSQPIIEKIKTCIPQYHTRAMRRAAYEKFGLLMPSTKKSVVRHLYKDLVGDASASCNLSESEIDERVAAVVELEEPSLAFDLRDHFSGRQSQFEMFWQKAKEFLEEDVGTATDDRRHSSVVHVAKAISVRDLREKVMERCPPNSRIPSDEWIRLQFSPVCTSSHTALRYTGSLQVRRKVQLRQWRKQHEDGHYAACIFRYEREYAVMLRDLAMFASIDDKHKVKIGEPNFPLASAERGRQVVVASQSQLLAADHDFAKFSITPSVVLLNDIPSEISGSWYDGHVYIMFKDAAFEPSSPVRHSAELYNIIKEKAIERSVLFLYSDGGPDHRVTYLSVKLSLIALYLRLDLDYLCAARTAPYHSYRNPVERVMSVVNLGLQAIALARKEMPHEMEAAAARCNNLKALRLVAQQKPDFVSSVVDSIEPVKILLTDIARRLELKKKKVEVFVAATTDELDALWAALLAIDMEFNLRHSEKVTANDLTSQLNSFFTHCCRQRHYFFDIIKCGDPRCQVCKPPRLPLDWFSKLGHLPDPVPGDDGHYKRFEVVFKTATTEEHRPSRSRKKTKGKTLPFRASVQHVRNTQMMLQCEECCMWRLVYAKRKLKAEEKVQLDRSLSDMQFSCGAQLQDADIPPNLQDVVFVRELSCDEPIEKLYYAAKFADICVHCASPVSSWSDREKYYPQCDGCAGKIPIENEKFKKRKNKK